MLVTGVGCIFLCDMETSIDHSHDPTRAHVCKVPVANIMHIPLVPKRAWQPSEPNDRDLRSTFKSDLGNLYLYARMSDALPLGRDNFGCYAHYRRHPSFISLNVDWTNTTTANMF